MESVQDQQANSSSCFNCRTVFSQNREELQVRKTMSMRKAILKNLCNAAIFERVEL